MHLPLFLAALIAAPLPPVVQVEIDPGVTIVDTSDDAVMTHFGTMRFWFPPGDWEYDILGLYTTVVVREASLGPFTPGVDGDVEATDISMCIAREENPNGWLVYYGPAAPYIDGDLTFVDPVFIFEPQKLELEIYCDVQFPAAGRGADYAIMFDDPLFNMIRAFDPTGRVVTPTVHYRNNIPPFAPSHIVSVR